MRDDSYLKERLDFLWNKYFPDIKEKSPVTIKFGKIAKKRLGSIKTLNFGKNKRTIILINGYFKDCVVPEGIVDATIAHELCHYSHGFGSSLPQLSKFPHRGGLVDKEMEKRGLNSILKAEQRWLNQNWTRLLKSHF